MFECIKSGAKQEQLAGWQAQATRGTKIETELSEN